MGCREDHIDPASVVAMGEHIIDQRLRAQAHDAATVGTVFDAEALHEAEFFPATENRSRPRFTQPYWGWNMAWSPDSRLLCGVVQLRNGQNAVARSESGLGRASSDRPKSRARAF